MEGNLTQAGIMVLSAPGLSTHIDFVNATSYEEELRSAGKAYLDWYMLTQVRGLKSREVASGSCLLPRAG